MQNVNARVVVLTGVVALCGWTAAMTAQGDRPPQKDDVLPQLLVEVRGLRAAMEQMASAGPRVELALGRLQLQEQRIANEVRRLDALKASIASTQDEIRPLQKQVKDFEEWGRQHPEQREDVEQDKAQRNEIAQHPIWFGQP